MKTVQLKNVKRGAVFSFHDREWILLEHEKNGSLALSKDIIDKMPFDEQNINNYSKSTIRNYLNGEFAESVGALADPAYISYTLDLAADDGTTYGECWGNRTFLLTDAMYRRNRDVIKPLGGSEWWWTATASSACIERSCYVRNISPVGTLSRANADNVDYGIRPACFICHSTLVSVDDADAEDAIKSIFSDKLREYQTSFEMHSLNSEIATAVMKATVDIYARINGISYDEAAAILHKESGWDNV